MASASAKRAWPDREGCHGEDYGALRHRRPRRALDTDGHGGPSAAQICQDELCAQLAIAGPSATDAALADAFWSVDARIGAAGDTSGTTAAVLLVDGWNMPGVVNLRCVLANVGDSRGLRVDMRSPVAAALPFATRKHTPADADEVNRLKLTVRVWVPEPRWYCPFSML